MTYYVFGATVNLALSLCFIYVLVRVIFVAFLLCDADVDDSVDSSGSQVKQFRSSLSKHCSVLSLEPVTDASPELTVTEFKLTRSADRPAR